CGAVTDIFKWNSETMPTYFRVISLDTGEQIAHIAEPKGSHRYSYAHSLLPIQFELPHINPKFTGKPYRYTYAIRATTGRLLDSLIKLDAQSKEQVGLWKEECKSPSEPIFVPRPDANYDQEDDGVVLLVVLDKQAKQSFLLVLDGITFKETFSCSSSHIYSFIIS
ncbi:unnamed protein product, partial [Rotaria sp. Silwood2]